MIIIDILFLIVIISAVVVYFIKRKEKLRKMELEEKINNLFRE